MTGLGTRHFSPLRDVLYDDIERFGLDSLGLESCQLASGQQRTVESLKLRNHRPCVGNQALVDDVATARVKLAAVVAQRDREEGPAQDEQLQKHGDLSQLHLRLNGAPAADSHHTTGLSGPAVSTIRWAGPRAPVLRTRAHTRSASCTSEQGRACHRHKRRCNANLPQETHEAAL
jgi:hypothetical protein